MCVCAYIYTSTCAIRNVYTDWNVSRISYLVDTDTDTDAGWKRFPNYLFNL